MVDFSKFDFYISKRGHLIIPSLSIDYLINLNESEIPGLPEATETTVRAAGRDGDIVLGTTYEPLPFVIVCYTEDNLTSEEKNIQENKIKNFFNEMKEKAKTFAIEMGEKFYNVKYNANLTVTNFPKFLQFSMPFKSSNPYGKDTTLKKIDGNGTMSSETVKEVGATFTIEGPATSPIISLNNYSMEYNNLLLENEKLIINSSNSTIIHINSSGIKTNAMRYYNHQFPKIEKGTNELKVLSGVEASNVSAEWYDYKF